MIEMDRKSALTLLFCMAPSIFLLLTIPPMWNFVDGAIYLLSSLGMTVGHYPYAYPVLARVLMVVLGFGDHSVITLVIIQHATFVLSLFYFVSFFEKLSSRITLVVIFVLFNFFILLMVHGVYSEAIFFSFLLVTFGASLRLTSSRFQQPEAFYLSYLFYFGGLYLAISTRHVGAIFAAQLPLVLIFLFFRKGGQRKRKLKSIGVSLLISVTAILFSDVSTRLVCGHYGSICTGIQGRSGVYRIHSLSWNDMAEDRKAAYISKLQNRTDDEIIRELIPIVVETKNPWMTHRIAVKNFLEARGIETSTPETKSIPDEYLNKIFRVFITTFHPDLVSKIYSDFKKFFKAGDFIKFILDQTRRSFTLYREGDAFSRSFKDVSLITKSQEQRVERMRTSGAIRFLDSVKPYHLLYALFVVSYILWTTGGIRSQALIEAFSLLVVGILYAAIISTMSIYQNRYGMGVSFFLTIAIGLLFAKAMDKGLLENLPKKLRQTPT